MNFDSISDQFEIKVGDRVAGYLKKCEYKGEESESYTNVWKLYTNKWGELATFDTIGQATRNLHALEKHLSSDKEWLKGQ